MKKRKWCKECNTHVLGEAKDTSHLFHLVMCFITFGMWLLVWGVLLILPKTYRCPNCGKRV